MDEMAFPSEDSQEYGDGRIEKIWYRGLTKREWFAGMAIQAVNDAAIASRKEISLEEAARRCFLIADSLIAEGEKK